MLKLTIKNPAPDDDSQHRWGDFHFGNALQHSLKAKGMTVFQDFQPNWPLDHGEDVVLVLRGLLKFQPVKAKFNILWIISHPAMVTSEELEAYDLVLTVSAFHCKLLREITQTPVEVARQCTEFGNFFPAGVSLTEAAATREGIVYVANSRGQRREMAQWIQKTHTPVRVFGRAWEKFGIGHLVEKEYIPNSDLPGLYRSARLCLNDHWQDMRAFGFINNRVFDSLACGLPLLTDGFPEIRALFGDAVLYAQNAEDFKNKIAFCDSNYEEVLERAWGKWKEIGKSFSFDARADEIVHWITTPPARAAKSRIPHTASTPGDITYNALLEFIAHEEEKTAYLETLISDQTRLADQARKEAIWARERKEEEKRAKEAFRERTWKEIKELRERIRAQEQAEHQLLNQLESVNEQLSEANCRLQKEKDIRSDVESRLQKEKNIRISLFHYAKILRNELETVYKSRSWKIGAPYRALARAVYGLLRGKRMGKPRIPDWPPSIAELDKPQASDVTHEAFKSKKSQPYDAHRLPTGSLQYPIFADQIFGAPNAGPKPEAKLRHSRTPMHFRVKRVSGSIRHRTRQILLPIKRRLSGQNTRALRDFLSRVRAKNSAIAARHPSGNPAENFGPGLSKHSGNRLQDPPVSHQAAPEIEQGAGYWHDKAMLLLRELETLQQPVGQSHAVSLKNTFREQVPREAAAAEAVTDGELKPQLEYPPEYWRNQVLQLNEELEYAKTHRVKFQG
jgi:hypothetical protein